MNSPEIEPYAAEIVDTLMDLVHVENEDNAVLCMKTIMDLERHQMAATASRVQPFLDLIQEMFQMMEQVVNDTFDNPTNHSHHNQPSQSQGQVHLPQPSQTRAPKRKTPRSLRKECNRSRFSQSVQSSSCQSSKSIGTLCLQMSRSLCP